MVARNRTIAVAFALVLGFSVTSSGQIPLGSEFRVDTNGAAAYSTFGWPRRSSAMAPDGEFVVAWTHWEMFAPDHDMLARRFSASGSPRGPVFPVSTATTGEQFGESVGIDDDGNFVVVWQSLDGGPRAFGQRFDASGTRRGAELQIGTSPAQLPSVAVSPGGGFVVVWQAGYADLRGRRYDPAGAPLGVEFQVNSYTTGFQYAPTVDMDGNGDFVVAWTGLSGAILGPVARRFAANGVPLAAEFPVSPTGGGGARVARSRNGSFVVAWSGNDGGSYGFGIFARRFDAAGQPLGGEFQVNTYTTFRQWKPEVDADADGDFVVTWTSETQDGSDDGIFARRYSASGVGGPEFRVNSYTTFSQYASTIAMDPAGNFVVAWYAMQSPMGSVFAQRFGGGLAGTALSADPAAGSSSDGNGVFEAGETVTVAPSWLNAGFAAATFSGTASAFTGPGTSGDPTYTIADPTAAYGTVASGTTASCATTADCYALGITVPSTRPAVHWDAVFHEEIAPANLWGLHNWPVHVGDSFTDVPRSNGFYRFIETLLHRGVTAGCTATTYCAVSPTTREQMAVFVLVAKELPGYAPYTCSPFVPRTFADVPASSPYCPWIEELARRGVVSGCGGGNYCPTFPVTREQMAVFVLRALDPALSPPACTAPMFSDVPASSPFCPWIEELARRGVVAGCGGGAYCPASAVTREQMAVFLSATFGLQLYGP